MKSDITQYFIDHRKEELKRRISKLPNRCWVIRIASISFSLLFVSFCTRNCCPWFSGALVSASCGCFTGLVFYFLSNLRNNENAKLRKEYIALKEVYNMLRKLCNFSFKYEYHLMGSYKNDPFEDGFEMVSLLQEIEFARYDIPLNVYDTVPSIGYDPLDRDNIKSYIMDFEAISDEKEMKKWIIRICDELTLVADIIHLLLHEREDQIAFLDEKFI